MIPYGRQDISQDDIDAVVDVLRSDFLTQGPVVPRFEAAVAGEVGADHGVAVSSATSALHIAVAALDLGPGDLLWTSPITFVASANCARYCGADVDFVDIDPDTFNMCPQELEAKLECASKDGRLPKVIVPVHMCGQSPDAKRIAEIARSYGIKIVEDASHAIGAFYRGTTVGCCEFSDITVFSFHPVKIVTSAEGGMALTNDQELAERMRRLRSHGITRDPALMTREADGPWFYEQLELGWNYRMTELQAALGLSQLSRLQEFIEKRTMLAERYDRLLEDLPVKVPVRNAECKSAFHLYVIRLEKGGRASHKAVFERLRAGGIGVNLHYIPVHLQPYYQALGFSESCYPKAEQYYREAITLPLYPGLSRSAQDRVVAVLSEALSA